MVKHVVFVSVLLLVLMLALTESSEYDFDD